MIRTILYVAAAGTMLCGWTAAAAKTDDKAQPLPRIHSVVPAQSRLDAGPEAGLHRAAAQGTTWLASYTFDEGAGCTPDGWTSVDRTVQPGDFFHVDDFAGLGGGTFGRLIPLEGAQSMWCGARPDPVDPVLCGYAVLPGYGNDWDQALCTAACLPVTGDVAIHFSAAWDAEPGYDATTLEYDRCDDAWTALYGGIGTWDGVGNDTLSIVAGDTLHSGGLRFRFHFTSDGAWSDDDGLWDTDGAFIVDALGVTDGAGTVLADEDFEDETPGDTAADDWTSCPQPGYGHYAALYPGLNVLQEDPCNGELSCLWTFYTGSTSDYGCAGYPDQTVVPYENARGQYIHNEIWSPDIPIVGSGSVWEFRFDVYRDLPLDPLIFYVWHINPVGGGCHTGWVDYGFVYYGGGKDWLRTTFGFGQLLPPGATDFQVAIGVRDMCDFWCGVYGDGQCHSHAPLFDKVEVYRVASYGPQWQVRDIDLFQDNFSADGTVTGTARADAALDILPSSSAGILPGDSVSVRVSDPEVGLGVGTNGKAAVYCYVRVDGAHGGEVSAALVDDPRYTYVGTVAAGGETWAQIQMDSSYTTGGTAVADNYNIDLNDSFFVPSDTVWFFFGAANGASISTYFSFPTPTPTGQSNDIDLVASHPDEMTILPAEGLAGPLRAVLYVDGMNFRGAQPYFDTAFEFLNIGYQPDRYDIRGPSSAVGNHPGSRVVNVLQQITPIYQTIIWNTGDLRTAIGDGSGTPDKSPDLAMLETFLDNIPSGTTGGIYLSGDDVAEVWDGTFTDPSATTLRNKYINFTLDRGDHTKLVEVSPYVIGDPAGFFKDFTPPFRVDTLIAYGGCPLINDFDVFVGYGPGAEVVQMWYNDPSLYYAAVLSQSSTNGLGGTARFILSGFSYHTIRDAFSFPTHVMARMEHLWRILWYLKVYFYGPGIGAGDVVPFNNALRQNHPNPFNPTTTIEYSIRERAHVSLRVYNVAGQLVRTLVDEVQSPESVAPARWDGRDDGGRAVASGVYFYKFVTKDYVKTKKMVLLK